MANAAVLSTSEVSTAISRGQHPQALTDRQREDIEKTWKLVEGEGDGLLQAGIQLFLNIFKIYPAAQNMFKSFCDVPIADLPENEDFCAHGLQVTETISLAISSLDDLDNLMLTLKDIGVAHGTHGLKDAHFDVVGEALIATLAQGLEDAFTPEVKEAYLQFYGFVKKYMQEGLSDNSEDAGSIE